MAMNGDVLGAELKAAVHAAAAANPGDADAMFKAMGNAIVDHIHANATVSVTTTTPGVQAGPSAAPGTGTGTIT